MVGIKLCVHIKIMAENQIINDIFQSKSTVNKTITLSIVLHRSVPANKALPSNKHGAIQKNYHTGVGLGGQYSLPYLLRFIAVLLIKQ